LWLFVGIYFDDEFHSPSLFVKHRPTFKISFYSPIGMSDLQFSDLSTDKKAEQLAFDEFVKQQNLQASNVRGGLVLPSILIQLTLSAFLFAYYQLRTAVLFTIAVFYIPS
jgi:hypothetical protein